MAQHQQCSELLAKLEGTLALAPKAYRAKLERALAKAKHDPTFAHQLFNGVYHEKANHFHHLPHSYPSASRVE